MPFTGMYAVRRASVPRMWPPVRAAQAEGSFAFNRIACVAVACLRFVSPTSKSSGCYRSTASALLARVHAQKSGRRVPTEELCGWWKFGANACDWPRMALCLRLRLFLFSRYVSSRLRNTSPCSFHPAFGCTTIYSGMWAPPCEVQPWLTRNAPIPLGGRT